MKNLLTLFFLGVATLLNAQNKPEVIIGSEEYKALKASNNLTEAEYDIVSPSLSTKKEKTTVYPSAKVMGGGGTSSCDCWIEPDATYTQAAFPNSFLVDDGSTSNISFPFTFELYGDDYTSMWINTNGTVTFDAADGTFTPQGFPNDDVMLAPFWGDVDLSCNTCGEVYYKVTDDAVYVNWIDVGYYNEQTDKLNTFQVVFTETGSGILPGDNTVQFCYQDMQWTTGSASGGDNGFGGSPATVGANAGNSLDYIQFGQFDQAGDAYDGPFGQEDGVSWLDFQTINFNANISANDNLPPLPIGTVGCDSLVLCANDTEILDYTFLAPENNQNMTVSVDDDGFPNIETDITSGSPANVTLTLTSGLDAGEYDIEIIVTDDGIPAASTSIVVHVEVIAITVPDLDITSDGELVETISYCQGQDGALLTGSDGFDSYEWSDGNENQSDSFDQGQYTLTAYFMGCDTEAGPVNVFEIPVFNPDVSIDDLFLCAGETTDISIDNPEDYQSVEWSVYNNDGEIITADLTEDTIEVTAGFYEVLVIDENDCPGSRIVPVTEEIVNIPSTNFAPQCDDNTISWSGAWAEPETCLHQFNLQDSEMDTWEGANLQVFIDGTGPFNFSIQNGAGFLPSGVTPYHGQVITYFWQPGLDDDDIDLTLFDGNNQVVFSTAGGDELIAGDEPFFTIVADCGFNALPGTWVVDAPAGGEGWTLEEESVFNPVEGSNTFTAPENFVGTYNLTFESDVCDSDVSFDLEFSTTPTVTGFDYNECGQVTIEPVYGPESLNGDFDYNWGPNVLNQFDGSPTATVNQSISYSIEVSNECGENEYEGEVVITPIPTADLVDATLCDNETITLNPQNSASGATYVWSDGSSEPTLFVNSAGTYSVDISNDCGTASSSAVINQSFSPSVQPWAFDTLICSDTEIIINPNWTNLESPVTWTMTYVDTLGNTISSQLNGTGPEFNFLAAQVPNDAEDNTVTVSYSATNDCGIAFGEVIIYEDVCFISATNVITPDNDGDQNGFISGGLNEGWYVYGIDGVSGVNVNIYDRWGGLVYESTNYSNDNPWRGKHKNGSDLKEGVYFYKLTTPIGDKEITGTITLLRK